MNRAHHVSIGLPLATDAVAVVEAEEQCRPSAGLPRVDVRRAAAMELTPPLLVQSRPQAVSKAVEKAAAAISHRRGEWGVDGVWSYDFSRLGYACSATSHLGAPELSSGAREAHRVLDGSATRDVLGASFERVRSRGGADSFRVLDLGAGSGGWLLQAQRDLEERRGELQAIWLHGITGDALPSEIRSAKPSGAMEAGSVEVAHFQQVGIETFPLRLGGDAAAVEQRAHFAQTVEAALAGGLGYDLIVSSWTFCHLLDPLATLELWSNALAVQGELYANDIDFPVCFNGEGEGALMPPRGQEDVEHLFWESDPEARMECAFEALSAKGSAERAFSIEFVYDDASYRTAVKVRRLSLAPVRFAPVVAYRCLDVEGAEPLLDGGGRPVYRAAVAFDRGEVKWTATREDSHRR